MSQPRRPAIASRHPTRIGLTAALGSSINCRWDRVVAPVVCALTDCGREEVRREMMRLLVPVTLVAACGSVAANQIDASNGVKDGPTADAAPDARTCPEAIDQQLAVCTSPPIAQCSDALILFNGQSGAQTFTPSNTGTIAHLRLRMDNQAAATNPVQVSIIDLQTNAMALLDPNFSVEQHVLARTETPMTVAAAWQDVLFATPAAVTSNLPYAILVRLVGTTNPGQNVAAGWNEYNDFQGNMVDSYPRVRFFSCGAGCSSWILEPTYRDAAFEVYVSPNACP